MKGPKAAVGDEPRRGDRPEPPSPAADSAWADGLEFELTDIGEARRILDEESISQFDVASVTRPEHWKRLRRSSLPTDRALTGQAIDWLLALPPTLRPQVLSRRFPRIANALAAVWHEPEQCQAAFDRLLRDERRGRTGFDASVLDELVALRNWTQVF